MRRTLLFSLLQILNIAATASYIQTHRMDQSQDLSFFVENENNALTPIRNDHAIQRNPVFYNTRKNKSTNQIIPVLAPNKLTHKLDYSEDFQDYLSQDEANPALAIATFLGPKKIGKSFLVDFLVSKEEKAASRLLSTTAKPGVNCPNVDIRTRNGDKLIYLDAQEDLSNEAFLWTYFLSSTFVLSLNSHDKKGEERFLEQLQFAKVKIESEPDDLSLPQLIVLRRDTEGAVDEREFLRKVENFGLFGSDPITLSFAYPGSADIQSKDVMHVSESALSKGFVRDSENLQAILKAGRPKLVKGNYLGAKIGSLALDPLTKSINKDGKVSTDRIWGDVIETLSVGYYNYYIKKYSEELQSEFRDEEPCDKYTLYKKMSRVRRNIDKKVEGFGNIAGDPTFEKYKDKLKEKIDGKEKVLREINRQKSRNKNNDLCRTLFSQMNDGNCQQLLDQYAQSPLDDDKAAVLLDHFELVIKKRVEDMEKSKNPAKKQSKQILLLEEELRKVEEQIAVEQRGGTAVVAGYDFEKVKGSIEQKEREVRQLEAELEKQKKLSSEKKANQNKDIVELESNIENLKLKTKNQETQIEKLRNDKESQVKETIDTLNQRLKDEEEKYRRLQEEVRRAQASVSQVGAGNKNAKPGCKDTCCQIM